VSLLLVSLLLVSLLLVSLPVSPSSKACPAESEGARVISCPSRGLAKHRDKRGGGGGGGGGRFIQSCRSELRGGLRARPEERGLLTSNE